MKIFGTKFADGHGCESLVGFASAATELIWFDCEKYLSLVSLSEVDLVNSARRRCLRNEEYLFAPGEILM